MEHTAGGGINWYSHFGKSLTLSTKLEHTFTLGPNNISPRYILNRNAYIFATKTYTKMFIAAFFLIAPNWNPPTCPPSLEWINKLCVHAMGYYTALEMNELLLQATWMNLTNTMLSKRIQTQKNADCMIPLMQSSKPGKN